MHRSDATSAPGPQVAYERWLDSLAKAGWLPRRGRRPGGAADEDGSERIEVGEALGRVTAVPVIARWPSPRADCAAMDGIAVRAADLAAAAGDGAAPGADHGAAGRAPWSQARPAADTQVTPNEGEAGDGAVRLPAGLFEWIDTGDPMPADTDTVIVRERLLPQADGSVII